jgi:mannose/cellobiose epimerase-like protein (N-acyl-D-glucosamine 2-epimerase family)
LTDIAAHSAKVSDWLFDAALPFWAEEGRDRRKGGFVERLDLDGRPVDPGFKRMRVQARQIYVFSHAALLGFKDGPAAAEAGYRFILDHGRLDAGGFARTLARDGAVLDPAFDLYDQAFVLFALAWLHKASGDREPVRLAEATFEAIGRRLGREDGHGYRACDPGGSGGLQNPHMHLLEAVLALYEATVASRWAEEAAKLAGLFRAHLFDRRTATLAERFEPDWSRQAPVVVEPGHQFEWAWLLSRCERALGEDFGAEIEALSGFALTHGIAAESGLVWDELDEEGAVLAPTHRLWPQTEHLKARLAAAERSGTADRPAIEDVVALIFGRYLDPAPLGAWRDRLGAGDAVLDDHIPASSLYHLFLAFAELLRLAPLIEGRR